MKNIPDEKLREMLIEFCHLIIRIAPDAQIILDHLITKPGGE